MHTYILNLEFNITRSELKPWEELKWKFVLVRVFQTQPFLTNANPTISYKSSLKYLKLENQNPKFRLTNISELVNSIYPGHLYNTFSGIPCSFSLLGHPAHMELSFSVYWDTCRINLYGKHWIISVLRHLVHSFFRDTWHTYFIWTPDLLILLEQPAHSDL